jgi:hypothetical protein
MKKFITIAALILGVLFIFSATSGFAQYAYFGVKGGINLSLNYGENTDPEYWWDPSDKKPKIGAVGGVYSTIVLAKIFAIQPELLFTMQGIKWAYEESAIDYEDALILKLNYIQLPVLLKFYIPMKGNVKINLFAGPYVAYNITSKYEAWAEQGGVSLGEMDGDIDDDWTWAGNPIETRKFDYGVSFGLGVDFIVFSDKQLTVDARYSLGLANFFTAEPADDPEMKNGTISAMVGIGF